MPPMTGARPKHQAPRIKKEAPQPAVTRKLSPLVPRVKIEPQQETTAPSPLSKPNHRDYRLPRARGKNETYSEAQSRFERINGIAPSLQILSQRANHNLSNIEISSQSPDASAPALARLQNQMLSVTNSTKTRLPALDEIIPAGRDPSTTFSPPSLRLLPIAQTPSQPRSLPNDPAPRLSLDDDDDPPSSYEESVNSSSKTTAGTASNTSFTLQPGTFSGQGITPTSQASTNSTVPTRPIAATTSPTSAMKIFADPNVVERIFLYLNLPTLLTCLRLSRRIQTSINFGNLHLRRALWLESMSSNKWYINRFRQNPHTVDPIIARLRQALDLFFTFVESTNTQEILWFPMPRQKNGSDLDKAKLYVHNASWRQMLVMRSADEGVNWRVGMFAQGTMWFAELGKRRQSPVFNEIVNVLHALSARLRADGA